MFQNATIVGTGICPESYHAASGRRGSKEFAMSPSSLKRFAVCAEEWIVEGQRLAELRRELVAVTDRKGREQLRRDIAELEGESKAKNWGSMVDARLLTPETFNERYAVRPETMEQVVLKCPSCGSVTDSPRCRKCKIDRDEQRVQVPWSARNEACAEWTDEQESAGKTIITSRQLKDCDRAVARLLDKPTIQKAVECSEKQVHVRGEWLDKASGLVIPVQCLIDFVPRKATEYIPDVELPWPNCLGDLKECNQAGTDQFNRKVEQFGWQIQAAFDLGLYYAATGDWRKDWFIIGQKNYGVFQPFKRLFSDPRDSQSGFCMDAEGQPMVWTCPDQRLLESEDFIWHGAYAVRVLMARYAKCLATGYWTDYDDNDYAVFGFGRSTPGPWSATKLPEKDFSIQEPEAEPDADGDFTP